MAEVVQARTGEFGGIEQILRDMGTPESHIQISLQRAQLTGEALHVIMRDFGFLGPEQVAEVVSRQTQLDYMPPTVVDDVDADLVNAIDLPTYRGFCPVRRTETGALLVAAPDTDAINRAQNSLHSHRLVFNIASEQTVQTMYRRYFARTDRDFDDAVSKFYDLAGRVGVEAEEGQVLQRVYWALLRHACYSGASDVYLHTTEQGVGVVRLKLNGVGTIFRTVTKDVYDRLIRKIISEAGVKEEELLRGPKDSIIGISDSDRREHEDIVSRFSFRLSIAQTRGSYSVVMRILDNQASVTKVEYLGFDDETMKSLRRMIDAPTGLIIVTGPTGSGKTTTLNAVLSAIDPVERSVQSIENPVEYTKGLWLQHEVSKQGGDESAEFQKWLKALLRRAPDVILMGEIRDAEVAGILLDAANTGHLALTTMHTNSAPLAFSRLKRFGLDNAAMASVLLGILAQRLVRTLCPYCKEADGSDETRAALAAVSNLHATPYKAGPGCARCGYTGHRGRQMVYELLEVTPRVRELIELDSPPSVVAREALPLAKTMYGHGLALVAAGTVSLRELERVAGHANTEGGRE
jgi:type II secretory ATPase GspE/PulE/Tfp pilus assembly ATPase PilB-like protein